MAKRSQFVFPFSFNSKPHKACEVLPRSAHWIRQEMTRVWPHYTLDLPDGGSVSVIGGDRVFHWGGDGIHTFEVWYSGESEPRWYQTAADIQAWLDEHYPPVEVNSPDSSLAAS